MKQKLLSCLLVALTLVPPGSAQNAAVTVSIDASANKRPINPYIYGVNLATNQALTDLNPALNRYGGNNTSRYNWKLNADNRAFDWYFESIGEPSALEGERGDTFFTNSRNNGAEPMITIPMIGWVAKLGPNRTKLSSFSVAKYGDQTGRDWAWFPDAGNGIRPGGAYINNNDPNDANVLTDSVFQQDWVRHLVSKFGTADRGGLKYYILDNEYSIWFSTHRDISKTGAKASDIRDKVLDYAARIKAVDPSAKVVAPEEWGWSGFIFSGYDQQYGSTYGWGGYLPERSGYLNGMDYLPWLLQQWKAAGTRPVDVFSLHYYPQEGEYSDEVTTAKQLLRNRSTRSLWDPNYRDTSWIQTQVKLIPRMKEWMNTYYYPGTPTAITEYSWGADNHINGATAQADILGIFGREGLDMANRWLTPGSNTPTYKAFQMYRNYDGLGGKFGDVSVKAAVPNPDQLSAFAALRTSDNALTVMVVNKVLDAPTPVNLSLAGFSPAGAVKVYQLTAANTINRLTDLSVSGGALTTTVPAQSITLFVLPVTGSPEEGNRPPQAVMSANPLTGNAPLPVTFSSAGSADPDGSIVSYRWQFGDGTSALGASVAKTYSTPGTYSATLTVTDNNGATATAAKIINVTQAPPPPPPPPPPTGAGCVVKYVNVNDWVSGFLGEVTITNKGTQAYTSWDLRFTFPGNQTITSFWNSTVTQTGQSIKAVNAAWNGQIPVNGSQTLGFVANYSGTNAKPTSFTVNGTACTVQQ